MVNTIKIGQAVVSRSSDPFVIAEAGVNHNGNIALAHELIDTARAVGADAVKFQTFNPSEVAHGTAAAAQYQERTTGQTNQRTMLEKLALPASAWKELAAHAAESNIVFISTPFDEASLEILIGLGVTAIKISSGDLTHRGILSAAGATGLPVILSSGASTLDEAKAGVEAVGAPDRLAMLHCVTAYPAPTAECNLRVIQTFRDTFDFPIGWSDHTENDVSAIAAVAMGATILEKHLTLDRTMEGPDHQASADPAQFRAYVDNVRATHIAMGDGVKVPQPSELDNRGIIRRSWWAVADIAAGTVIDRSHVRALRPEGGMSAMEVVLGRTANAAVTAGEPIRSEDLDPT